MNLEVQKPNVAEDLHCAAVAAEVLQTPQAAQDATHMAVQVSLMQRSQ